MSWRKKAAPLIRAVIKQHGTTDLPALKKALRAAYPFLPRKYHPYKIWLDEIRSQLGTKRSNQRKKNTDQRQQADQLSGQQTLFQ
ncbi:MAG TPA: hypothetical protein PLY87_30910 [Planctomycetaceae bacterium]|nr:hypothetical protein [Planctomycetaceae bacterium]